MDRTPYGLDAEGVGEHVHLNVESPRYAAAKDHHHAKDRDEPRPATDVGLPSMVSLHPSPAGSRVYSHRLVMGSDFEIISRTMCLGRSDRTVLTVISSPLPMSSIQTGRLFSGGRAWTLLIILPVMGCLS